MRSGMATSLAAASCSRVGRQGRSWSSDTVSVCRERGHRTIRRRSEPLGIECPTEGYHRLEASVERALVELARDGDEEAFASLIRMAGDRLMAVAFRILRDTDRAEDAVQQAIVSAWRDLPALRDPDRFNGWLYRVLVNACYVEARRTRRWNANVRVLDLDVADRASDELLSVEDRDELERAFRRLPPEQRAAFVLHHYAGMRITDIGEALEIPVGTVKSRLHYATAALRAAIEADARAPGASREGERLA
jgi:RNA polymerase sigma-70 factor (ECF subfamily)